MLASFLWGQVAKALPKSCCRVQASVTWSQVTTLRALRKASQDLHSREHVGKHLFIHYCTSLLRLLSQNITHWGTSPIDIYFSNSGGWESKVKMPTVLVPGKTPLPGFQMAFFLLCPQMAERELDLLSLFIRALISPHGVPPSWLHLNLITSKSLTPEYAPWGLGLPQVNLYVCVWGEGAQTFTP